MFVINEKETIQDISRLEGFAVHKIFPLTGGSINKVFLLETSTGRKVLKLNKSQCFPGMFDAEADGLKELKKSKTVDVPKVFSTGETGSTAYLLLQYKEGAPQKENFWSRLSQDLSALHKVTASTFGFYSSNYIGSLPQYNSHHSSAAEFYLEERLEPQLRIARNKGFSFPGLDAILKNMFKAIPEEAPALLHGDLWNGNLISNKEGMPCLIDPAVSYGPREMDLAMMRLFGGFPKEVFKVYEEIFPLPPGSKERVSLWQLYYLLVHLNIFGRSYLPQVTDILSSYR